MKIDDLQNLSAYAVYNNKVQGVKVYQEANKPKSAPKPRKKSRVKSTESNDLVEPLQKPSQSRQSNKDELNTTTSSESASGKKNKRKRKNKRKSSVGENVVPEASEGPKSKILKTSIELPKGGLLPNPFAQKKGQLSNNGGTPWIASSPKTAGGSPKKSVGDVKINGSSPVTSETKTTKKVDKQNGSNQSGLNSSVAAKKKKKKNKQQDDDDVTILPSPTTTTKSPQQNKINNKDTPNKRAKKDQSDNKKQSPSIEVPAAATTRSKSNSKAIVPAAAAVNEEFESSEIPIEVLLSSRCVQDSVEHGKNLFQWLISPVSTTQFMSDYWEKAPLHIKRIDVDPDYYKWILSSTKLDDIMRKNLIRYGKNIDITSYTDGQRQTHNPVGRAMPAAVWDYYTNGCSVRFLNPQTYVKPLWRLNASLQEYFGTFVGANVYLTPADSQGFAPHYDDIEAFILQVEGRKHWKLYKPRTADEELPRVSSGNFSEETDNLGEPILDVVLEEGDLLYFPRGIIHQARAVDEHSLHITISCYQTNTWGDLLKEYLSTAVDQAMENSVEFRRGLPIDYLSFMGIAHHDNPDKEIVKRRKIFINHSKKLVQQLVNSTTPDLAADQLGKKFMWDALPPYLTVQEKNTSSFGDGEFMDEGEVYNRCEFDPDTDVKLVRKNCIRLVCEENTFRLYFTLENSMEYHGEDSQFLEITPEAVDAMKTLILTYPEFIKIENLPMKNIVDRIQLITDLWERGLIVTKKRLVPQDDDVDHSIAIDDDYEEDDDGEFSDDVDIGDDSDDSDDLAEFDDSDDDEDDTEDEFVTEPFGLHENDDDDDDDDDDSEIMCLDSFDDFVERVVSDEDENVGKSYIEEVHSSEDEVPQLVSAQPVSGQQEDKQKNIKRRPSSKKSR